MTDGRPARDALRSAVAAIAAERMAGVWPLDPEDADWIDALYELRVLTTIAAPPDQCFDLARSVDAHVKSATGTGERVVAGRTSGLLELGDEVTWEGRHFGVVQRLSSRITALDRPVFFQDRMTRGAFRSFEHDHRFTATADGRTEMLDVVRFASPFGPAGWLAERLVLSGHLRRFLVRRGQVLRRLAERPAGREDRS